MTRRSGDARPLPKGTLERLAACQAVGLHYWSDHPVAKHFWAVDDHQQAHVVKIDRDGGTARHVCRPGLLIDTECAGDDEAVPYAPTTPQGEQQQMTTQENRPAQGEAVQDPQASPHRKESPMSSVSHPTGPAEEPQFDPDDGELGEDSIDDEPTDSFNIDDLRYDEAEFHHGDIDAPKTVTAIKVRKPHNAREWFMLHPSQEYQLPAGLYERVSDDSVTPETYLVLKRHHDLFITKLGKSALKTVRLRLAVNSLGTPFLWDMRVPRKGQLVDDYQRSVREAAEQAEQTWVKLEWNAPNRAYDYSTAPGDLGEPQFPVYKTMFEWVKLGFKDRIIDKEDHIVAVEFQGRQA